MSASQFEKSTGLNTAEKWLRDGIMAVPSAGFFVTIEVEMTAVKQLIEKLKVEGVRVTYTHVLVKATAMVLDRHRELHQMVNGCRRWAPHTVDIGVAVAGPSFVAPNVVIRNAQKKSLLTIARELEVGAPKAAFEMQSLLDALNRWGWLVPFSWLRVILIRWLLSSLKGRRKNIGTFQISCVRGIDHFVPLVFSNTGILGMGEIRQRVFVIDGRAEVRPTALISCAGDHKVWTGIDGAKLLSEINLLLTENNLKKNLVDEVFT